MSEHKESLVKVLEYIVNDEQDKAADLLHNVFVEKAKSHWSSLQENDEVVEDEIQEDDLDLFLGYAFESFISHSFKSTYKQYKKLFEMDGINFSITPSAIDYIVDKAMEYNLGARGLRNLCEAILNDAMFNLPNSEVKDLKVTKVYADQKLQMIDMTYLKAVS